MSHLSVPHTIQRGNTYHFNLRHKSSIVRRSLRTSCRVEALDKLVRETIDNHLSKVGFLFEEKNSYGDMLFNLYQHQAIQQQFTHMYESDFYIV